MIPKLPSNNLIALDLRNRSNKLSTTFNLFALGQGPFSTFATAGPVGASVGIQSAVLIDTDFIAVGAWSIAYNATSFAFPDQPDIETLVNTLNAQFTEYGRGIFSYRETSPTTWLLIVASAQFTFSTITPPTGAKIFGTNQAIQTISGSSAQVTVESGLGYTEVAEELTFQPYLLSHASVFASNIEQANVMWKMKSRDPDGYQFDQFQYPAINPMVQQFAVTNIPIYFTPDSTNLLEYTLKPSERVRVILQYHKGNVERLGDYVDAITLKKDITDLMKRGEVKEAERVMEAVKPFLAPNATGIPLEALNAPRAPHTPPIIQVISLQRYRAMIRRNIRTITGNVLEEHDIEQSFAAFNGTDFTELS